MRKAVFLDRDGVLNRDRGEYTFRQEDFSLLPGVLSGLKKLVASGYELVIITNQGGIAKGLYTKAEVDYLHLHLERFLANHGVKLAGFYYCPHHPETGNCICRKPDSLLLEKACAAHGIDPSASYFIGDAQRDADAAKKACIHPIQIPSNTPLIDTLSKIKLN